MNTAQAEAAKNDSRSYSRKEVVDIIRSILSSADKTISADAKLHSELTSLAAYIENMRADLAQMRSIEISHTHIPAVTDELDAVVGETAKATGTIMDSCERIEKTAKELNSFAGVELADAVTCIYEACGFQDITGQRITKVVKTLKQIESKVTDIINAFNQQEQIAAAEPPAKKEEKLLNGPQLKGAAASQQDIDKLLASFDK